MSNPFDQFDGQGANPFDRFDGVSNKLGADAFPDFLRSELKNADWGTRNIAGFGTALSNAWEGLKSFAGKGDQQQIAANKVIEQEAPVGSVAGNVAMTAIPFGVAGNSVNTAAKVGLGLGLLKPVEGEQTPQNIVRTKIIGGAEGALGAALGQGVANKAGDVVSSKLADLALQKSKNAPLDKTLADAIEAGLTATPTAANPTAWNAIRESIGGKIATAQETSNRNAPIIDNLARKAVGLDEAAPLTSEAMRGVRAKAWTEGYEPVASVGPMNTDAAYAKALDDLVAKYKGASSSFPGAFDPAVANAVAPLKVASFDSADALKASQILREEAKTAFRDGLTDVAQAKKGAAKAIEDQIERNLSAAGQDGSQLLQNFRDARTLMAKAHTVEDAIVEGGGSVDARKLAARVQAGKPLTDELAVIGNFANNFKGSVQPAKMIQGPAVSKLDLALATVGGGMGLGLEGKEGGVVGALAPFLLPRVARAQMLSNGSQNELRRLYQLGLPTRTVNSLRQYFPVGGAVLGADSLP